MLVPFAIQSAEDRSLPSSAERAVNFYAQQLPPNAKVPVEIIGTPGFTLFSGLGGDSIRAMYVWDDNLYAVSGASLYKITSTGSSSVVGSVPSTGTVYMADNGAQLGILVGASMFTFNGTSLAAVTDGDYGGGTSFDVLDGFGVFTQAGSRQYFISALRNLTSYDALDIAQAESTPDDLVRVVADRELWFFKTRSTEVWYNAGTDFPFARVDGGKITKGLAAAKAVARLDNSLAWLGDDRVVYRANGFTPQRISTHAIEKKLDDVSDVSDAFAFAYAEEGHSFFVLTVPGQFTVVYDAATQLWHDRESYGYSYWRPSSYAFLPGSHKHLFGDYITGNIYQSSLDVFTENGNPIIRSATSPPIKVANDRVRATMHRFEIDFEVGVGLTTGQGSNPQAMLQWSDDGGKTWSNEHWRTIGPIGNYKKRLVWNRLGQFRHTRTMRVTVSDPVKVVIAGAYAEVEGGML